MKREVIALLECEDTIDSEWLRALDFEYDHKLSAWVLLDDHGEIRISVEQYGDLFTVCFGNPDNGNYYPHDVREVCVLVSFLHAMGPIRITKKLADKIRKSCPEMQTEHEHGDPVA